jgi:NDP-sugar pyrophosphorylase family protein
MSEEPRWAAVILAAGYGSRLQKDIEADASREFDHLLGQPKGLLPVGGVPLLDHWLRAFRASADRVGPVIVVTNELFHRQFTEWAVSRGLGRDAVVNDGTTTNEQRLGACGDLELALRERAELIGDRDVLVVAGDTLFFQDFELGAFLDALPPRRSGVVTYQIGSDAETRKRGIVELEPDGRVAALLEKPEPSATSSRAACPAFYAYRHACKALIRRFLAEHAHAPLECKDAPGQLLAWLLRAGHEVQAVPISGRFDIGSLRAGAGAERSGGAGEGERRRSAEGPAGHRGPAAGGGIWAGQRAAQAVAPERRAAA